MLRRSTENLTTTETGCAAFLEYAKVAVPVRCGYTEIFDRDNAKVVLTGSAFFIDLVSHKVPE
ncbi:MAG: hypothetical protein SFV81_11840 [Pirellulaceae bacterium]|nr:hypothetical protein [Pirellulaceae bacterium]